jgi:hypothetical protein
MPYFEKMRRQQNGTLNLSNSSNDSILHVHLQVRRIKYDNHMPTWKLVKDSTVSFEAHLKAIQLYCRDLGCYGEWTKSLLSNDI